MKPQKGELARGSEETQGQCRQSNEAGRDDIDSSAENRVLHPHAVPRISQSLATSQFYAIGDPQAALRHTHSRVVTGSKIILFVPICAKCGFRAAA